MPLQKLEPASNASLTSADDHGMIDSDGSDSDEISDVGAEEQGNANDSEDMDDDDDEEEDSDDEGSPSGAGNTEGIDSSDVSMSDSDSDLSASDVPDETEGGGAANEGRGNLNTDLSTVAIHLTDTPCLLLFIIFHPFCITLSQILVAKYLL